MPVRCPSCGRNETGQVGTHEFYCWNCCLEFHGAPGSWRLFALDTDGALLEVGPAAVEAGDLRPVAEPAAVDVAGVPASA